LGIETFSRIIKMKITMVDRMRPESSPAAVTVVSIPPTTPPASNPVVEDEAKDNP
jgi:hypothetical protein